VKPPGGDWTALVVLAIVGGVALSGLGFLGGYAVGYAQPRPVASSVASPEPTVEATITPFVTGSATPTPTPTPTPVPTPTPSPTPTPTPAVDCYQFGDFPNYPGSLAVAASTQDARAWHVYASATQVANYYTNGASQLAWQFRLTSVSGGRWTYRISRAPACRGSLVVMADPAGGTLYQATPDS
jgi:hypothetical protein